MFPKPKKEEFKMPKCNVQMKEKPKNQKQKVVMNFENQ